ncbi:MAG: N-6 DNA methylase [Bacteroidales bacterium]|nr:N-6 DNA methylase [Bacteroidales bacterium]
MLDTQTKRRIDDCRDILVGKLPDPKAQIEQITIGLIYKFMDDMDKEAIELGGKSKFFSDYLAPDPEFPNDRSKDKVVEFSRYAWNNLLNPKVTAAEMLTRYSEAIQGMEKNPNIPQLFRDIFKNAYLPYRDPETLKLFLKTIAEFEYTHSEKLGDAFEYLLSVMGSQGDAGQFRTPRHIIDFLVAITDPGKTDAILDPACGTAGFLISAYKHILLKHTKANQHAVQTLHATSQQYNIFSYNQMAEKPFNNLGDLLTPDERKKLIQNFAGYDISPDMVRLSLVNLYLHGFNTPSISEYDTLSSEERWNESYDVILANPPFMSPKGGIRPHKRFTISSNRSEVLFVDYIAEHLNPNGRAGIIVPEGIIFQSGTAYRELRKMLVENYLYAVVSLPAGVFNPYSGVKTSILLLDKELAKKRDEILFIKIGNDGYNLGAQRNAVKGSQLEEAIAMITAFRQGSLSPLQEGQGGIMHLVPKPEIVKSGDYNLSGERYKSILVVNSNYEMIKLSDERFFKIVSGGTPSSNIDEYWNGSINWATLADLPQSDFISSIYATTRKITEKGLKNSSARILPANSILVSTRATIGRIAINALECATNQGFKNIIIHDIQKVNTYFVALMLTRIIDKMNAMATGGTFKELSTSNFKTLQIPLPPLSIQEEIVAEIEGYQKIIDGAKAVVANYKPKIDIDPEWEMVELGNLAKNLDGKRVPITKSDRLKGKYPYYGASGIVDYVDNYIFDDDLLLISEDGANLLARVTPIAFSVSGKIWVNNHAHVLKFARYETQRFIEIYLNSISLELFITGSAQPKLNQKALNSIPIPLPPLERQHHIVAQIEKEQELVNANKQLIEIFEQKIKDRIAKVWGKPQKKAETATEISLAAEPRSGYVTKNR